jgi:hypothetical protein
MKKLHNLYFLSNINRFTRMILLWHAVWIERGGNAFRIVVEN